MAFRSAACALVVLLALMACAEATYDKKSYKKYYKKYDEYKECKYKHEGDECYHPDVKDKCLKDAKCEYDEHYHKLKCVPGKSYCYDTECKYAKCYYGKCKYYNKKDYTPCDTDYSKCTVEKCYYGECKKDKDLKCDYDYEDYKHKYDKECIEKEGYCDPKYGCVGPKFKKDGYECGDEYDKCSVKKCYYGKCKKVYEKKCDDDYHYDDKCVKKAPYCDPKYGCVKAEYYEDGYDCSDEHDKCTVKKCYYGKCKKVEKKKCDDYEHDYDKQCVKKWGYCDPKYGCVETKLYDKGYYCYKYYYGKKYKGYCSEYGKCEVEYHDDKKYDDDKHDDKHDDKYDDKHDDDHKEKGKGY